MGSCTVQTLPPALAGISAGGGLTRHAGVGEMPPVRRPGWHLDKARSPCVLLLVDWTRSLLGALLGFAESLHWFLCSVLQVWGAGSGRNRPQGY